jgi:A/G-specific adenine glycosylase
VGQFANWFISVLGSTRTFNRRLLNWYDRARRDLPWRECPAGAAAPNPYHVLVSEAMLQQTQVSTVIPYFKRFIKRFGSMAELAAAGEQEVLKLWQGLGYYSRARNLRAAAQKVCGDFGGTLPRTVRELLQLPGVGPYTAGAIASIAFGARAPILDGNVERVLCRLDRIESDPREPATRAALWKRAAEVLPASRVGDFNSALMELGATVCTPRSPQCLVCPVRMHCLAREAGIAEQVPPRRKLRPSPLFYRQIMCIRRGNHWLIEQRPARGRWAGLWQFVTTEAAPGAKVADITALPVPVGAAVRIGEVSHALTHRRYHFVVYRCDALPVGTAVGLGGPVTDGAAQRAWVTLTGLKKYPLPRQHVKVCQMLEADLH